MPDKTAPDRLMAGGSLRDRGMRDQGMRDRLAELTMALMAVPGLSGHEGRIRKRIAAELDAFAADGVAVVARPFGAEPAAESGGLTYRTDRLGNLIATLPASPLPQSAPPNALASAPPPPSVMMIAHMDQLGFLVRRIEADGLLRLERLGGVPEKALPAQAVLVQGAAADGGGDITGVIANTSHHITPPDQKYRVTPYAELYVDCGFRSADEAQAAGVAVGAPVVYAPRPTMLANGRIAGPSVDDRAGCAVLIELLRALAKAPARPTVHAVFSVQEEFNLRGALTAAQALQPDIAVQIDLALATDTPDLAGRGDVALGGGPAMSLFSFHGRGTLNGLLPHPAMVRLISEAAAAAEIPLQRTTHMGALTETSYVQLVGQGVACVDLGFPCRCSHSAAEICDVGDLAGLTMLLVAAIARIGPDFSLDPDAGVGAE